MQRRHLIALAAATCFAGGAFAQAAYPAKPIRLIVPFAPGGTTDIISRVLADPLSKALGQSVVVDNKGGAGGAIGAAEAARAAPDGYTLSMATVSTIATNPAINKNLPYDPIKDFVPIVNVAAAPNVITAHPSFPAKNYQELLAAIKKEPGKYSYASTGTGGISHMQMELFKSLAGADIVHIPYRGAGPALNDVVAGQVPLMLDNLASSLPFIQQKRLVPMVVAAPQRLPALPDVPTLAEVGMEPVNRMAFYGLLAPKGTPKDIVDKLNAATRQVLADPAVKKRIEDTGSIVIANTADQFAQQIKDEFEAYKQVVQKQKLTLN
ncbi:tripartite tricarboxylate transporter substrate binding protein BugE [Comamonadaceae bacterium OH2545_COT-014]|nr:tripartite tricarboxylate transporter substrate binding protein BugE [Comamonadaceae bacterium OH2545_COT-014]